MQRKLRLKRNLNSWSFFGQTNPRSSGVFYCLRLCRKVKDSGSYLVLSTSDGRLKFNPITGAFSANIPNQDMAKAAGLYIYELTETANGATTLLQKGELTIAEPKIITTVKKAVVTTPVPDVGDTICGGTGDDDFDLLAFYKSNLIQNIGNPDNPSPLD